MPRWAYCLRWWKRSKKRVEEYLQQTWESADNWFY
ncbi:DinI-like family protein [Enterobacter bugandensis]